VYVTTNNRLIKITPILLLLVPHKTEDQYKPVWQVDGDVRTYTRREIMNEGLTVARGRESTWTQDYINQVQATRLVTTLPHYTGHSPPSLSTCSTTKLNVQVYHPSNDTYPLSGTCALHQQLDQCSKMNLHPITQAYAHTHTHTHRHTHTHTHTGTSVCKNIQ